MGSMSEFLPLEGVRVVEASHMIFGPSCGMFFALLGAEVIKVEPVEGDKTRQLTGMGASFFATFNRGKKSITLDLDSPDGRKALDKLLESSDILVENFRDASLDRMGLDPERLRERFPRLIIVSCKGFLDGPYKDRPALDEVVQMMTGLAYMTGPSGMPLRVGSSANDIMGGLFGAFTAIAALGEREETGQGRALRVGLFENSLLLVAQHMVQYALLGVDPSPMPERSFSWPVYDIFHTADGNDLFIGAVTDGQWHILCRLLELQELIDDPRLSTKMDRINARGWTIPLIQESIGTRPSAELAAEFELHGIPFGPVAKPSDMYSDPQACGGGLPESQLPDGRRVRAPGLPVQVDGKRIDAGLPVPVLGKDTAEVLQKLGFGNGFIKRASGHES